MLRRRGAIEFSATPVQMESHWKSTCRAWLDIHASEQPDLFDKITQAMLAGGEGSAGSP